MGKQPSAAELHALPAEAGEDVPVLDVAVPAEVVIGSVTVRGTPFA